MKRRLCRRRACVVAIGLFTIALATAPPPAQGVQFGSVQTLQSGIASCAALTIGPEDPVAASTADGCLYAVNAFSGTVSRICFDASKVVTSSAVVIDLNGGGSVNALLGITFDPASDPAGEMHLYLAYADDNSAPFQGKIARAVSTNGGASYTVDEDFITGLARSPFDHQTNGLSFGGDGCLYVAQGNASNAGYDSAFAESRLSSAMLRACFKDGSGAVNPAFDRNCGGGNTQQACSVEVYASGLRNPYDLVWHSNGRLYATDNDVNLGFRDNCGAAANTFGCPCQVAGASPVGDELNLIEAGYYYGSPNPARANPASVQCQGGSDGTDACTTDGDCAGSGTCQDLSSFCTGGICGADVQCYYFGDGDPPQPGEDPSGLYRQPIAQVGALLDGISEYRAPFDALLPGSFCSDWDGDLLVTGGPGSVRRFTLSPDGLSAAHPGTGNLSGLVGLDVAVGADGTVYTADFIGARVAYITPVGQPNPLAANFFQPCQPGEGCVNDACAGLTDNDGDGFLAPADCDDNDDTVYPGAPELCDNQDNDCDGQTDDGNPGGGGACGTGQPGLCAAGTLSCQGGSLQCVPTNPPGLEICNALDDDCDGQTDEGVGGAPCGTGQPGVCAAGTLQCQSGTLVCTANVQPSTEVCNTLDDDCDGTADEGNPGSGGSCTTGLAGACAAGTYRCLGGSVTCEPNSSPNPETCNGVDDDCDGSTDEGNPGSGGACTSGLPGICAAGTYQCQSGSLQCATTPASAEICDALDNDCDGTADEGNPGGGACGVPGQLGACAAGTLQCQSGSLQCAGTTTPAAELCSTSADEDCDGQTDEASDCVLCLAADTVASTTQTQRTKVQLKDLVARDKLLTGGTFVLPAGVGIAPDQEAVTIQVTDAAGAYWEATIPAGGFQGTASGRSFKFSDPMLAHGGVKLAKFAVKSDQKTVKYRVKAQALNVPAFLGNASTVTVRVGGRCFTDAADTCTLKASGVRCE